MHKFRLTRRARRILQGCAATGAAVVGIAFADGAAAGVFTPGDLVVSRVEFPGGADAFSFANPDIQGRIFLDQFDPNAAPGAAPVSTVELPSGITTSFGSKSEGALMLSADGHFLTYMGYQAAAGTPSVSNSFTPQVQPAGNTAPTFNREVALITAGGSTVLQPEANAYSGDNPRAVISKDGKQFYMVGNSGDPPSDSTIGVRFGTPGSDQSSALGAFTATDNGKEKKPFKDNNFRSVGIFDGQLYVSKGSGSNGDNGIFQVGTSLPTGPSTNVITPLPGLTQPSGTATRFPFGFFFANSTTLYVADEGGPGDTQAGLEKWVFKSGTWSLVYTIQSGLNLGQDSQVSDPAGETITTQTTGLRNMTGRVNDDGTVTLFAITAQTGENDPTSLVELTDLIAAGALDQSESFVTLETSAPGEVFRGVAFAPVPEPTALALLATGILGVGWTRRRRG